MSYDNIIIVQVTKTGRDVQLLASVFENVIRRRLEKLDT